MPLYLPDFSEIMAVAETRGEDSEAPHLWRGLVGAWPLQEPGGVTVFDASGRNRHGTLIGPTRVVSPLGRAVSFVNNYIALPTNAFDSLYASTATTLSVAFWLNTTTTEEDVAWSAEGYWFFRLNRVASSGIIEWDVEGGVVGPAASSAPVNDGLWHLVVGTLAARTETIWIDGRQNGSKSSVTVGNLTSTSRAAAIGANHNGSLPITALMTGVSVYNRALAPAEIQQLYADPWAMYRLRTVVHPVAVAEPSGFKPYWLRRSTQIIGGGVA